MTRYAFELELDFKEVGLQIFHVSYKFPHIKVD